MASQPTFAPPEVPHIAATASLSEPDPVRPKPGGSIFRGDVVEDLDLPPALCISEDTSLARAIELGAMREYDMLPVLDSKKRPIGYLDCRNVANQPPRTAEQGDERATKRMTTFRTEKRYQVITPDTPLEELEAFFQKNSFCVVTDRDRRFVLGIATREDLAKYVQRRYGSTLAA